MQLLTTPRLDWVTLSLYGQPLPQTTTIAALAQSGAYMPARKRSAGDVVHVPYHGKLGRAGHSYRIDGPLGKKGVRLTYRGAQVAYFGTSDPTQRLGEVRLTGKPCTALPGQAIAHAINVAQDIFHCTAINAMRLDACVDWDSLETPERADWDRHAVTEAHQRTEGFPWQTLAFGSKASGTSVQIYNKTKQQANAADPNETWLRTVQARSQGDVLRLESSTTTEELERVGHRFLVGPHATQQPTETELAARLLSTWTDPKRLRFAEADHPNKTLRQRPPCPGWSRVVAAVSDTHAQRTPIERSPSSPDWHIDRAAHHVRRAIQAALDHPESRGEKWNSKDFAENALQMIREIVMNDIYCVSNEIVNGEAKAPSYFSAESLADEPTDQTADVNPY